MPISWTSNTIVWPASHGRQALQKRADAEPNNPEAWHTMATYYTDKVTKDVRLPKPKVKEYTLAGIAAADKAGIGTST